jgi:hypothetical protein
MKFILMNSDGQFRTMSGWASDVALALPFDYREAPRLLRLFPACSVLRVDEPMRADLAEALGAAA